MGDLFHFPIGRRSNVIFAERFLTKSGEPVEILTLAHRGGESIVWQTGDDGTLDEAIVTWRACGARLLDRRAPLPTASAARIAALWPNLIEATGEGAEDLFVALRQLPRDLVGVLMSRVADGVRTAIEKSIEGERPALREDAAAIADEAVSALFAQVADLIDGEKGGHA